MQIEVPPDIESKLRTHAEASGYADVREYALARLAEWVDQPLDDAAVRASEEELRASVESVERDMRDARAGLGVPMKQALGEIADELGLRRPSAP